ncbi:hypothetical protein BR10RB9215_C10968 [Brucella sp. 10RB9215]|nr:hypothetical protein BR10RB9215_C10968 [Brucella sp. 10RB9215]
MIVRHLSSPSTVESLRSLIARQMADVLLDNDADLGDINACRRELGRANFGGPAIDALVERACDLAAHDFIANWKPE